MEFRYDRPVALSIGLAAEFNGWKSQAMKKGADGVWSITIPLQPGTYGYKFLVNRILMGGCNENTATAGLKRFLPPYSSTALPIFLSSGTSDTIASPEQIKAVEQSMKANGFGNVRLESCAGAHDVFPEHTTAALNCFTSTAAASATATPKSDFDNFFKKK